MQYQVGGLALRQPCVSAPGEPPQPLPGRERPERCRRLGGQNQHILHYISEQAERSTCRRLSRHFRQVSLLPSGSPSSPRGSWDGPGVFLCRSQSSLGWGGDKARSSGGVTFQKVLCQRRSDAIPGSRGRLEGPDARIQPGSRSESRQL